MGNSSSSPSSHHKESPMTTWAIAQYMSLCRDQLLDLRDACLGDASTIFDQFEGDQFDHPFFNPQHRHLLRPGLHQLDSLVLSRAQLEFALKQAGVKPVPDVEIISDLYTLWDEDDQEEVPLMPFMVSLAPLACHHNDTFRTFFQFALEMFDVNELGRVSPENLRVILTSLNKTVKLLGDECLSMDGNTNVIDSIVSEIAENISLTHQENGSMVMEDIPQDDVVTMLAVEPWIRKLLAQKLKKQHRVKFAPNVLFNTPYMDHRLNRDDDDSSDNGDDETGYSTSSSASRDVHSLEDEGEASSTDLSSLLCSSGEELSGLSSSQGLSGLSSSQGLSGLSSSQGLSGLSSSQGFSLNSGSPSFLSLRPEIKIRIPHQSPDEEEDDPLYGHPELESEEEVEVTDKMAANHQRKQQERPSFIKNHHDNNKTNANNKSNKNSSSFRKTLRHSILSPRTRSAVGNLLSPRLVRIFKPKFSKSSNARTTHTINATVPTNRMAPSSGGIHGGSHTSSGSSTSGHSASSSVHNFSLKTHVHVF